MAADSLQSCRRWAHCAPAAGTLSQIRPFPVFSVYFSLFFFFFLIGRGQIPVALWNPEFVSKAVKIRAPFVIEGFFFFLPWNFKLHKAGLIFFFFFFFLSLLSFDSNAKWLSSWDFAQLFLSTSRHRSHRGIIAWHLGVNPFETAADYS